MGGRALGGTADLSSEIRPKLSQMCVRVRDVRPRACSGPGVGRARGWWPAGGPSPRLRGPRVPCPGVGACVRCCCFCCYANFPRMTGPRSRTVPSLRRSRWTVRCMVRCFCECPILIKSIEMYCILMEILVYCTILKINIIRCFQNILFYKKNLIFKNHRLVFGPLSINDHILFLSESIFSYVAMRVIAHRRGHTEWRYYICYIIINIKLTIQI